MSSGIYVNTGNKIVKTISWSLMLFCSLSLYLDSLLPSWSEHLSFLYLFTVHGLILLCWRMLLPCRKQWYEIWRVGRLIIVFWKEISITKCERRNFISPIFRLHFTLHSDRDVCSVDLILLLPFHCLHFNLLLFLSLCLYSQSLI